MSLLKHLQFPTSQRVMLVVSPLIAHALSRDATRHHYLIPHAVKTPHDFYPRLTSSTLVTMCKICGIGPYLAERLYPHLQTLPLPLPAGQWSTKIIQLADFKRALLDAGVRGLETPFWIHRYQYAVVSPLVPPRGISASYQLQLHQPSPLPIQSFEASDEYDQYHSLVRYISSLLFEGVPMDSIKLAGAKPDDVLILQRIAHEYGWQFHERSRIEFRNHPFGISFVQLLRIKSFHDACAYIATQSPGSDETIDFTAQLQAIAALLTPADVTAIPELVDYFLDTMTTQRAPLKNVVECISVDQIDPFDDQLTTIVLHASEGNYPSLLKDNDYLSDREKQSLGWPTSVDENKRRMEAFQLLLQCTPHLVLFSAQLSGGKENHPLPLHQTKRPVIDLGIQLRQTSQVFSNVGAATDYAKLRYRQLHYGASIPNATELARHFDSYLRPYDAQFTGLSPATANRLIGSHLRLSATSIQTFQDCHFRYLLEHGLHLATFDNVFALEIGNMSHQLLEEAFRHHLPQLPAAHIESSLTLREFYLARLFEKQLTTIYRYLADRELATQFRDNEFERSVQYVYAPDPRFIIKGKIDRIQSYTDERHRYVVVMDYKTSNKDVDHERLQKGLDLQLVFYLHLLEHDATFGDFEVAGFYYQPLNLGTIKRPRNELNDPIPNLIKLQGVTLNNVPLFQAYTGGLDSVRNVKVTKKQEFNTNAKKRLQEPTWFDQLLKDINHHIEHAIEVIQHGDYRINPQPVNKKAKVSPSCEYCSFSSVCYLANSIVTSDEDEDDTDDGTEDLDNG